MAAKIRKGDKVLVLAGKYRGIEAEVLQVMPKDERVLVRGVNMIKKHQRQTPGQQGGIVTREAPIHISNVALSVGGKPSRVGFKTQKDGSRVRVARKTGEVIDG
jgi:large subunit ribosomal protein L24